MPDVIYDKHEFYAIFTLNRPERLNALDWDMRICSTEAYFGLFEPKRGILAGYGIHHLPRVIGLSAANHVLLTADRVEPQQALAWGIVTEVVEPARLIPRAVELAEMI